MFTAKAVPILVLFCSVVAMQRALPAAAVQQTKGADKSAEAPSPNDAQQVFQRVAPSVFVVVSLDARGDEVALGSGVAVGKDEIVTNQHVVAPGVFFRLRQLGRSWPAKIVRCDTAHDLCILSASRMIATPAVPRLAPRAQAGERVFAVGAPEGLELSISDGLVSGLRTIGGMTLIQISAPISHGSSGGGLFDAEGHLLGITRSYLRDGQNLNFAIPSQWVDALLSDPSTVPAALPQHHSVPATLTDIHKVCVDQFGETVAGATAQELLMTKLLRSHAVGVTEQCGNADAEVKGFIAVTSAYRSRSTGGSTSVGRASISDHDQETERTQHVTLEVRLVDGDGNLVWADSEESDGGFSRGPVDDAVDRAARRLADALEHAHIAKR